MIHEDCPKGYRIAGDELVNKGAAVTSFGRVAFVSNRNEETILYRCKWSFLEESVWRSVSFYGSPMATSRRSASGAGETGRGGRCVKRRVVGQSAFHWRPALA
jgi:hypothetical protein